MTDLAPQSERLEDRLARVKASPRLNAFEADLAARPQVQFPVTHHFIPGFYCRQIFMPAGTELTSKIHRTEHPFMVTKGKLAVFTEDGGMVMISAPYTGITKPGTRRALKIFEDTIWTTFHATDETDVGKIEQQIIEPHDIPALSHPTGEFVALAESGI